jgi:hypothetical protein
LGALDLAGAQKMMCLALGSVDFLADSRRAPNGLIQIILIVPLTGPSFFGFNRHANGFSCLQRRFQRR